MNTKILVILVINQLNAQNLVYYMPLHFSSIMCSSSSSSSSCYYYYSSGAESPLIGGFGILNYILPLCSILDTG